MSRNDESTGAGVVDGPKPSLKAALKRAAREFKHDHLNDVAAGLTYYAVLSVVPGLVVMIAVLGLIGKHTASDVIHQVSSVAPGSSAKFVRSLIEQAQAHKSGAGVGAVLGIIVALWSASGYVAAFRRASNRIYGIGEGRPLWKTTSSRIGVTILAVVFLFVSAVIVVVSGPIAQEVGNIVGAGSTAVLVWNIVKWPVLLILVSILLAVLYWASPNAKVGGIKWVSPGGVIATLIWIVISALFAVYVTTFASYDKTYGPLAGIIIFLVWLWLTNIAVLLGAQVNAELDRAQAIQQGMPEGVEPFAEPRDTRKLDDEDRRQLEQASTAKQQ